jgi:hypothetical protein
MKIINLGKVAKFLIPSVKVHNPKYSKSHSNVATKVHRYLIRNFGGYTSAPGTVYGYYGADTPDVPLEYYELREFRAAFQADERGTKLHKLQEFLSRLCADIGEECIYLEYDGVAMTVRP